MSIKVISPGETIEEGVAVMCDGKYWGKLYEDGHSTSFGYGNIGAANIADPEFCKRPQDMTYSGSHYVDELKRGKLVKIRRRIIAEWGGL